MAQERTTIVVDRRMRPHVGPRERRRERVPVTHDRRRRSRDTASFDELVRALTSAGEFRSNPKRG